LHQIELTGHITKASESPNGDNLNNVRLKASGRITFGITKRNNQIALKSKICEAETDGKETSIERDE
jgi:hypothetical protein